MKNLFLLLFLFASISMLAQKENKIEIDSKISSITVYIDGAEISSNQTIVLKAGRNLLVFKNISKKLLHNSIRVSTENDINILSVSSKVEYMQQENDKPRVKQLKDSLKLVNTKLLELKDLNEAYGIQKKMLLDNSALKGSNSNLSVVELKQASDFYLEKMIEINKKISEISQKTIDFNTSKTRLNAQLLELNANSSIEVSEIMVLLSSESAKNTNIDLRYLVSDAGWAPSYDLKVADINQNIDLTYRAQVFNNTAVDWENVKLKLSSGDPSISAESPILKPWELNYVSSNRNAFKQYEGYTQNMAVQSNMMQLNDEVGGMGRSDITSEYTEVEVSELSIEFDITEHYDIPSDNKPYFVEVAKYELPATYKHLCVPKVDKDVFLLARITGWEDLNLVEGPAHVYFAGTYVGNSYIYTRNVRDTLDLSLGRDKKVLVTRSKLKDFSSVKMMGAKRKETLAYQMIIKNNRNAPINIEVQDQIPISKNSDIEVDVLEISSALQDLNTGKLTWEYNIAKGETKKIDLKFAIKYPKTSVIQMDQSKTKMMRKF